jgi:hypothetical protein
MLALHQCSRISSLDTKPELPSALAMGRLNVGDFLLHSHPLIKWSISCYTLISTPVIFHNVWNSQKKFTLEACDVTELLACDFLSLLYKRIPFCLHEQLPLNPPVLRPSSTSQETILHNVCKYVTIK